jgi:hypothetical protein
MDRWEILFCKAFFWIEDHSTLVLAPLAVAAFLGLIWAVRS